MFLILAGYTALGALLFIAIESPHETDEKNDIDEARLRLMRGLWDERNSGGNFTDWEALAKDLLKPYDEQLYHSFTIGVSPDTDTKVWTFWKAMFFCSTITTTIGELLYVFILFYFYFVLVWVSFIFFVRFIQGVFIFFVFILLLLLLIL
ncbi:TWiK family of potassium channels protein 7-like [Penaeus monodon]|uniref:TWiK family of potassium channels protein 7-like n=1 Tax=Penaeus monodon TaxID=6687 RepID=UPI0018A7A565|nr:TWiK family of potassium channels protein 7-like [Penaeus monodon]